MKKHLYIYIFSSLLFSASAIAQSLSDTVTIQSVEITETKSAIHSIVQSRLFGIIQLSPSLTQSAVDVLTFQTPLFIKNYGAGNLATIANRGMAASQTLIAWEGIPLNSSSNGQYDLSLLNGGLSGQLTHSLNSFTNQTASGGLGGSLTIGNEAILRTGLEITQRIASYDNYTTGLRGTYVKNRLKIGINGFYTSAQNNFIYTNPYLIDKPKVTQVNNQLQQYGGIATATYYFKKGSSLKLDVWQQYSNRNLSPTMLSVNQQENQIDQFSRYLLQFNTSEYFKKKATTTLKLAYFDEYLNYTNRYINLISLNRTKSYKGYLYNTLKLYNRFLKFIQLNASVEHNRANIAGYAIPVQQTKIGAWLTGRLNWNTKHYTTLTLKQEVVNKKYMPFLYQLNHQSFLCHSYVVLLINAGCNYRMPSLNDLYWNPGGNSVLKPELSNAADIALDIRYVRFSGLTAIIKPSAYINKVHDWIQWQPTNSGYWQASNLKSVLARGYELTNSFELKKGQWKTSLYTIYAYTKSTNVDVYSGADASLNRQLMYTPIYQLKNNFECKYNNYFIGVQELYTSWRAISVDNYDYLPAYAIFNISCGAMWNRKGHTYSIKMACNNVSNTVYEVVAARPMLPRNYELTLSYKWNK